MSRRRKAMTATAQVFEFMATRLNYTTEQITEAAKIWNARIQAGKAKQAVTQLDMIEALEGIIEGF